MTKTGCGHFGEHQVLEVYPDDRGPGNVIVAILDAGDIRECAEVHGVIHTVKVRCLTCGAISLMPMTFPK